MNQDVIAELIRSTVAAALDEVEVPTWRPGTVTAVASASECTVVVDGDTGPTPVDPGGWPVTAGDRVMVLFYPPRGVLVVARLNQPAAYAVQVVTAAVNPADATTYYFGGISARAPATAGAERRIYMPRAGTIRVAYITHISTVAGSNEAWPLYVRVNDATSYLIESLAASTQTRVWSNTAMQVPVAQGDYIEIEAVSPTWATNPTSVAFAGTLLVA